MATRKVTQGPRWAYRCIFAGPLVAAITIITLSPNYAPTEFGAVRASPIGGDFLQEWIGGKVVADGQVDRLYDSPWTQSLQHDSELLGFRWDQAEYFPMVYPPFYYWLVSPLSALDLRHAAIIWCLLNALAFSIGLVWLAHTLRDRLGPGIWWVAMSALFYPLLLSLGMGQKSGFLLLILVATYSLARRGHASASGVVFGCMAFKPHLALLIGPSLLFKRQFAFAAGALLVVGIATGICLGMGENACRGFWEVCRSAGSYSNHPGYTFVEAHNIWGGMQYAFQGWAPGIAQVFSVIFASVVVILVLQAMRGPLDVSSPRFDLQVSALIIATILLSPHFFTYDLSLLLIPLILGASFIATEPDKLHSRNFGHDSWLRTRHIAILAIVFFASGLFQQLAVITHLPLSVLLLSWWLVVLVRELKRMQAAGDVRKTDARGHDNHPDKFVDRREIPRHRQTHSDSVVI